MTRPLDGVRVLDLSRLLPGPFCTLVLSDLGAQVDKVEDPHAGDYLRVMPPGFAQTAPSLSGRFVAINRNKRSLSLDLKHPEGKAALLRLLPRYDVLVESFRPGVLARLGLSIETLHAHQPRLVVCSISGYGQDGPYRDRAGHDLNYCALAGVLGLSGSGEALPPHPLPIQLADLGAGGLWAVVGILGALRAAERTGKGEHLDISMCEGTLSFLIPDLVNQAARPDPEQSPARGGDSLTGGLACYGVYATSDGKYLSVAALEPKFWLAFNVAIGRAGELSELLAPPAAQERIRAEIQDILATRTRDEWVAHFGNGDVCVEPVLSPAEVRRHPLHAARQVFFQTAEGALPQVRTPVFPRDGSMQAGMPPQLGEQSAEILREAGFSGEEIAALQAAGVMRGV